MYLTSVAASTSLLVSCIIFFFTTPSLGTRGRNHFRIEPYRPTSFWVPSPDKQAQNVLSMRRRPGSATSAAYMQSLRRGNQVNGVYGYEDLDTTERGAFWSGF